jgi:hypothetical protein
LLLLRCLFRIGENLTITYDGVNGVNIANKIAPTETVAAARPSPSPSMQQ